MRCQCGAEKAHEDSTKCHFCWEVVCPQCSVDTAHSGRPLLLCAGCYDVWLEEGQYDPFTPPALTAAQAKLAGILAECERIALGGGK